MPGKDAHQQMIYLDSADPQEAALAAEFGLGRHL